ncbi:MAG: prepilin peptidase [Deltaproteobacteria bacterium]
MRPLPRGLWELLLFAGFVFGAVWGSFLNVVVVRVPRGESIVFPASHCTACGKPIRFYDNVPIVSWLLLRGRCRDCAAPISPRYAIIEGAAGLLGLAVVAAFGPTLAAVGFFVFLALLLAIAAIDLEHWIIPHELSWPGIVLGLAFSPLNPRTTPLGAALGAGVAWAAFTILSFVGEKLFKKEALGLGDRWLLALEGAFLGLPSLLPVVFLSSLQGSIVGLVLIATGRNQKGTPDPEAEEDAEAWVPPRNAMPFGPFLALAGLEVLFFGPWLLHWYVGLVAGWVAH